MPDNPYIHPMWTGSETIQLNVTTDRFRSTIVKQPISL